MARMGEERIEGRQVKVRPIICQIKSLFWGLWKASKSRERGREGERETETVCVCICVYLFVSVHICVREHICVHFYGAQRSMSRGLMVLCLPSFFSNLFLDEPGVH